MQTLTKKQKLILDFINSYINENGISPTNDEIRKKFKLKAISTVHEHVNALKEKGYISKSDNLSRSIETNKNSFRIIDIPVMGTIAAGQPIEAIEDEQDTISIVNSSIKSPKDYYALRVQGDSMIEEGIFDGDIVVIKKQSVAENGQTVVAIIDDNEATLKKLYREKNKFRLEPRNQSMLPFFRKEVEVRGVVVQIISNPKQEEKKPQKKTKHGFKTIDLFLSVVFQFKTLITFGLSLLDISIFSTFFKLFKYFFFSKLSNLSIYSFNDTLFVPNVIIFLYKSLLLLLFTIATVSLFFLIFSNISFTVNIISFWIFCLFSFFCFLINFKISKFLLSSLYFSITFLFNSIKQYI